MLTCAAAASALIPFAAVAQSTDATVTFYAHGSFWTSGLPGSKHSLFVGKIFDGSNPLLSFHEGLVTKNNRFVTLHLPAGPHDFAAADGNAPKSEVHIPITLEAGKQYFFRAQDESSGIVVVTWTKARLDQVTCREAQTDAPEAKPLKPKHSTPALASSRVDLLTMPGCS